MDICKFYKHSGLVFYKDIYFNETGICYGINVDDEDYYSYTSKNIYIHNNIFYKFGENGIHHYYNEWRQTNSGEWDWYKIDHIPALINIDNYLEKRNEKIFFDVFVNETISYIESKDMYDRNALLTKIKPDIYKILFSHKFSDEYDPLD